MGSCNSYKTWSAALSWWVNSCGEKPTYALNPVYKQVHDTMLKLYLKSRGLRLPILLIWIVKYLKHLNVTPSTWNSIPLEILTKALLLLLAFFAITRPSELLFTDSTENKMWEIITTGLRWSDITLHNMDKRYIYQYMKIKIHWFKNQEFRNEPKIIYMSPPICDDKSCHCQYMDFFAIYCILQKRRNLVHEQLHNKVNKISNKSRNKALLKQYRNLNVGPSDYIFVGTKGSIWRPSKLTDIINELVVVIGMKNSDKYTSYSLRIGATSLCNQQEIDILKLLKYVAWSINKLPHVSNRYVMFDPLELSMIPFEMIHGRNRPGAMNKNNSHKPLEIFNPWDGKSCEVLFK